MLFLSNKWNLLFDKTPSVLPASFQSHHLQLQIQPSKCPVRRTMLLSVVVYQFFLEKDSYDLSMMVWDAIYGNYRKQMPSDCNSVYADTSEGVCSGGCICWASPSMCTPPETTPQTQRLVVSPQGVVDPRFWLIFPPTPAHPPPTLNRGFYNLFGTFLSLLPDY
ncbi:hypothetical protein ACFE04_004061 [Oxalis oulophora]